MINTSRILLSIIGITALAFAANADDLFTSKNNAPKLRLEFHTQGNENQAVRDFFAEFARQEGFVVEDTTDRMPLKDGLHIVNIELTRGETGSAMVTNIAQADQFFVFVYERKPDAALEEIESRLTMRLKKKWTNTVVYEGI